MSLCRHGRGKKGVYNQAPLPAAGPGLTRDIFRAVGFYTVTSSGKTLVKYAALAALEAGGRHETVQIPVAAIAFFPEWRNDAETSFVDRIAANTTKILEFGKMLASGDTLGMIGSIRTLKLDAKEDIMSRIRTHMQAFSAT